MSYHDIFPTVCLQLSDSFWEFVASSSSARTPKLLAMMPSLPNYKCLDPDVWAAWHGMCTVRPRSSRREAKSNAERPERSKPKGCQTWQPWTLSTNVSCRLLKLHGENHKNGVEEDNICPRTSTAFATSTVAPSANSLPNASSSESHIASSYLQSCQLFTARWNRMVV